MTSAIVVTGASSGIGATTATLLAREGFVVFAGFRQEVDGAALGRVHENMRPLPLDVTKPDTIAAAAERVRTSGFPLAGVVNNAGIAVAGPLEFVPIDDLRRQFEVNLFGAIAATQGFLPLLRETKGRVVFVGSISGRLAVPFIAPYSASKFALRAAADAMRIELAPFGIRVALVEPGSVKTPIWEKGRAANEAMLRALPPVAMQYYAAAMDAVVRQTAREERAGIAPERVADTILHALTSRRPRAHYLVGTPARAGSALAAYLPTVLRDRLMRRSMRLP